MPRPSIDETGNRYGWLVVLARSPLEDGAHAYWLCRCECGALVSVAGGQLRRGKVKSCGCYRRSGLHKVTHGKARGGKSRVYRIWNAMRQRCYSPSQPHYVRYGGRGITVCDEWRKSFEAFYRDMGDPPTPEHSIDRVDNDGNYEPGNCRWVTSAEQRLNQRKRK